MARRLYAIANLTKQYVTLTSTETDNDTVTLNPITVTHTGGKDGDYCHIPKCSSKEYFEKHHLSITGGPLNLAVWTNDERDYMLYYSPKGTYDDGIAVADSRSWNGLTLMIDARSADPAIISVFPY